MNSPAQPNDNSKKEKVQSDGQASGGSNQESVEDKIRHGDLPYQEGQGENTTSSASEVGAKQGDEKSDAYGFLGKEDNSQVEQEVKPVEQKAQQEDQREEQVKPPKSQESKNEQSAVKESDEKQQSSAPQKQEGSNLQQAGLPDLSGNNVGGSPPPGQMPPAPTSNQEPEGNGQEDKSKKAVKKSGKKISPKVIAGVLGLLLLVGGGVVAVTQFTDFSGDIRQRAYIPSGGSSNPCSPTIDAMCYEQYGGKCQPDGSGGWYCTKPNQRIECYKVDGNKCISAGLYEGSCPAGTYSSSSKCKTQLPKPKVECYKVDGNKCISAGLYEGSCPKNTYSSSSKCQSDLPKLVECYKADGNQCISAGLYSKTEGCPAGTYSSSSTCNQNIAKVECYKVDGNECISAGLYSKTEGCPAGTYNTSTECYKNVNNPCNPTRDAYCYDNFGGECQSANNDKGWECTKPGPVCGNGNCEQGETVNNCSEDCISCERDIDGVCMMVDACPQECWNDSSSDCSAPNKTCCTCSGGTPTLTSAPSPKVGGACMTTKIYTLQDDDWVETAASELPEQVEVGDKIRLAVKGDSAGVVKGRFKINNSSWISSTEKNSKNEYYIEYTLASGGQYTIAGEVLYGQ